MAAHFDECSLLMVAGATKSSKLYSVIPTDGDGDLTFSRTGTATRMNSSGVMESVATETPALHYGDDPENPSSCPFVLIEPQRTNLVKQSEDLTASPWSVLGTTPPTLTNVAGVGLDGGSATKIEFGSDSASRCQQTIGDLDDTTEHHISLWAKTVSAASTTIDIKVNDDTIVTAGTLTITNSWTRFDVTYTSQSVATSARLQISNNTSGDAEDIYVWGVQMEEGGDMSSYIPTTTTAVTRNISSLQLLSIVTNDILTGTAGTILLEGQIPNDKSTFFSVNLADQDDSIRINNTGWEVRQGGVQVDIDDDIFTADASGFITQRIAISWSGAGTAASSTATILVSQNGSTKSTDLDEWNDDTKFSQLNFEGVSGMAGVKALAIWERALTQTELNSITSQ